MFNESERQIEDVIQFCVLLSWRSEEELRKEIKARANMRQMLAAKGRGFDLVYVSQDRGRL